ncbi:MAG: hypothetical protein J0I06_13230 [Planctomycetes bacterium]|nr:hypothetical protein [Planctomycetota bacterium]
MLSLFAHHAEAFFKVEINGRDYPDGMTEHAIFAGIAITVLVLMSYGIYAGVRDFLRWKRRPVEVKA